MRKPGALRTHLIAALPELERDADRLLLFVDAGSVPATYAPGASFQYAYTLNVVATDMTGDPDLFMYHLLRWIHDEQSELLNNPGRREEMRFEVDVLGNDRYDLSLKIPVTERVIVTLDAAGMPTFANPPEPQPDWGTA